MAPVHGLTDGQVHHGIAEELEALVMVGGRVRVFVELAAVDESLVEESLVRNVQPEPCREFAGRAHGSC
jgi:hypothetical protein